MCVDGCLLPPDYRDKTSGELINTEKTYFPDAQVNICTDTSYVNRDTDAHLAISA